MSGPSSRKGMGAVPYEGRTAFRVWAPHADSVHVAGTFNDWSRQANPLWAEDGGYWSADVEGASLGDEYRFFIRSGGQELWRIDPYALQVTNSIGNGVIYVNEFDWSDDGFETPHFNEMVLYEMHVGTFNDIPGDGKPGNLKRAIGKLPYLAELGVNAVQLMPLMEFPGGYSWGYNPSCIFAVESDYGGPGAFKEFVNEAHRRGIAVILDVVYNHFGPSDLGLWRFDGWSENDKGGIYFYNDWRSKTPWGDTRPDFGREEVRRFLRDNAMMWLEAFHVDGLRFDGTLHIRNGEGRNNDPGSDIAEGWSFMQELNAEIHGKYPRRITIAEDMQDNGALVAETTGGGAGFSAQWDAYFVHRLRKLIASPNDEGRDLSDLAGTIAHGFSRDPFDRVIYAESHDEVANGKTRLAEEVSPGKADGYWARRLTALASSILLTSPGIPMLFQGQEFVEDRWFEDRDALDWSRAEKFKGIVQLHCDLIALRLNRPGTTRGLTGSHVRVHHVDNDAKIIAFHRWNEGGPHDDVVVVANFSGDPRDGRQLGFPREGGWRVRFNGDAKTYDEEFSGHAAPDITAGPGERDGFPATALIDIGPHCVVIYSQDE